MEGVPDYHGKAALGEYYEAMRELGASPELAGQGLAERNSGESCQAVRTGCKSPPDQYR